MSTDCPSLLSPTVRLSGALLIALLLGLSSACSGDEDTPVATGGAAGSNEPVAGKGGTGAVGGTANATAGADDEPVAGSGGMTAEAGTGGATSSEAGSAGSGAVGGTAGGGSAGGAPIGTIYEQVSAYLTSCGQTQGAAEATQNCNPDNELSQCVVACMLAKPCDDVGNWPAPILGCVSECGA